jgi:hypothetical protein
MLAGVLEDRRGRLALDAFGGVAFDAALRADDGDAPLGARRNHD